MRVLFKTGTQAEYDALKTAGKLLNNALYFIIDSAEGKIYKGENLFANGNNASETESGLLSAEDKITINKLIFKTDPTSSNKIVTEADIEGLEHAMHFRGVFNSLDEVTNPKSGDIAIVGTREYIYGGEPPKWNEIGSEDIWATKEALGLETTAREEADTALQGNIDSEKSARETADNTLQSNIDSEKSARESADSTLQSNIDAEKSARESAVSGEATVRETADTTLQGNIDAEKTARETAVSEEASARAKAVSDEATARTEAINAEASARSTAIEAEATTRANAITSVETKISNLTMPRVPEVGTIVSGTKTYDALFTNGCAVTIKDNGTNNIAYYQTVDTTTKSIEFPYNAIVLGGNVGTADKFYTFDSSMIIVESGKLRGVYAGCRAYGTVAVSTIIVNGGTFIEGVFGGGASPNPATENTSVGKCKIIINDGTTSMIYGGGMGGSTTGQVDIEINGGTHQWVTGGGSNGVTGIANITINGGSIVCLQTVNRGSIEECDVTINGGTITNVYAGGETGDTSVTGKCEKTVLHLNGGTFTLNKGTYGGVEDASRCSGDYIKDVVTAEKAAECNLTLKVNEAVLTEDLTSQYSIGGVKVGDVFTAGTSLEYVIKQILSYKAPKTDELYYYGAKTNKPTTLTDVTSLTQGSTALTTLLNNGLVLNIKSGDPTTYDLQYPIFACEDTLQLTDWKNNATGISYFTDVSSIHVDGYYIYYKNEPNYDEDIGGEDYKFEFKEAE